MNRKMKVIILTLIVIHIVLFVDYKIYLGDDNYFYSKDNGGFARMKSVTLLSSFFYFFNTSKYRLVYLMIGFFIGIICFFSGFLLLNTSFYNKIMQDSNLNGHILSCFLFIICFYLFEDFNNKIINKFTKMIKEKWKSMN